MIYLKKYKLFESKLYPDEVVQTIKDIFLELQDDNYRVEVTEPKLYKELNISIISKRGESVVPFTLGDIKDEVQRMVDYLQELNTGYFLEEVDGYGPTFKNFKKIELPTNVSQWEDDQQIVLLNLY